MGTRRYLGRVCPMAYLEGCSNFESGVVDQWVEFAVNELTYMQVGVPDAQGILSARDVEAQVARGPADGTRPWAIASCRE